MQELSAKDGRKVVLRTARWDGLDDLLELINSLVDEMIEIKVERRCLLGMRRLNGCQRFLLSWRRA